MISGEPASAFSVVKREIRIFHTQPNTTRWMMNCKNRYRVRAFAILSSIESECSSTKRSNVSTWFSKNSSNPLAVTPEIAARVTNNPDNSASSSRIFAARLATVTSLGRTSTVLQKVIVDHVAKLPPKSVRGPTSTVWVCDGDTVTHTLHGVSEGVANGVAHILPTSHLKAIAQLFRAKAHFETPNLACHPIIEINSRFAIRFRSGIPDCQPAQFV